MRVNGVGQCQASINTPAFLSKHPPDPEPNRREVAESSDAKTKLEESAAGWRGCRDRRRDIDTWNCVHGAPPAPRVERPGIVCHLAGLNASVQQVHSSCN